MSSFMKSSRGGGGGVHTLRRGSQKYDMSEEEELTLCYLYLFSNAKNKKATIITNNDAAAFIPFYKYYINILPWS